MLVSCTNLISLFTYLLFLTSLYFVSIMITLYIELLYITYIIFMTMLRSTLF